MNLSKAKIFLVCCLAFISGTFVASFVTVENFLVYFGVLILSVLLIYFWQNKIARVVFLTVWCFLLGLGRYNLARPNFNNPNNIAHYNNQGQAEFAGVVATEPDMRVDKVKLTVAAKMMISGEKKSEVAGRVILNAGLYPRYNYGDLVSVRCQLKTPEVINDFSYDKYLALYDIYSVCYSPQIKLLARDQGNLILGAVFKIKTAMALTIDRLLPAPQSALFKGILLGLRQEIPENLNDFFRRTGTTHIIAISGGHITLISGIILTACYSLGLRRRYAFYLASAIMFFYVAMIGLSASALRAFIMGFIVMLAMHRGRLSRAENPLLLAATAMLLINPKLLRYDVGFQLSFASVIGLIYFGNPVERLLQFLEKVKIKIPELLGIRENIKMTLSAQIATTPLIVFYFGQISVVAPVANILILPAANLILIFGLPLVFLGFILAPLARILFWAEWLFLTYFIKTAEILSSFRVSSVQNFTVGGWFLLTCYLILGYWLTFVKKREPFLVKN